MSLKLRVNLFFSLLLLISLLVSIGMLMSNARQSVYVEMEDTMNSAARLITISLSGTTLNRNMGIYEHLQELVKALSEIRSLHILLFDSQGLLFEGEPKTYVGAEPPDWIGPFIATKSKTISKTFW